MEDEEFEYDNEFSVDYLGKTVVGNYSGGKRTSPIDYYIFDTKRIWTISRCRLCF